MAEPYLSELRDLAKQWFAADGNVGDLECRHFFAGAAVYRNGEIVASLTPVGLAFKVPNEVHNDLLDRGLARPLRYFSNAPIKRNYVLFTKEASPTADDAARLILGETPRH